jgi:alkanesulfonate monooxygenase SsuD/methylene tetrahydromethanopterin reductase-like flavin-dependent oxidoreductase (luciferase family)
MRLGIYFDGFSSASEIMDVAHQAEMAGADSLWFAQHMGYREAMMMAAAVAGITKSSKLVPTAITPYLWPSQRACARAGSDRGVGRQRAQSR